MGLSVIVHDLNVVCAIIAPDKAKSPLIIDSDAVLPLAISLKRLQVIARRNTQTEKVGDRMQLQ